MLFTIYCSLLLISSGSPNPAFTHPPNADWPSLGTAWATKIGGLGGAGSGMKQARRSSPLLQNSTISHQDFDHGHNLRDHSNNLALMASKHVLVPCVSL